jgi:hypothetical protein
MAKGGGIGPDEIAEMFSALGLEIEFRELEPDEFRHGFNHAALAAAKPGAQIMKASGVSKDGKRVELLLITAPVTNDSSGVLDKPVELALA